MMAFENFKENNKKKENNKEKENTIKNKKNVFFKRTFLLSIFIFVLFSSSIFLSSCDMTNISEKKLVCNSGNKGLFANFDEHNILVRENSYSSQKIFLKNLGVFDSNGVLKVNYNPDIFKVQFYDKNEKKYVDSNDISFFIEGKKPYNECKGGENLFLFRLKPYSLPVSVNKFEQEISLDACYKYGFNFSTKICVEKNSGEINALKNDCIPKEQYFSGQGSPIVLSKISKPEYYDGKLRFKVFFENKGSGFITADKHVQNSIVDACNLKDNVKNYIYIKGFVDNYRVVCSSNSEVENKVKLLNSLEDNSYFLECYSDFDLDSTREMFLTFEVAYYYNDRQIDKANVIITN